MSWSQSYATVRLVDLGWAGDPVKVKHSFTAYELTNDTCAPSSARWTIQARQDAPLTSYPWYAVITCDDDARTRFAKFTHARKVRIAQEAVRAAERELHRLTH